MWIIASCVYLLGSFSAAIVVIFLLEIRCDKELVIWRILPRAMFVSWFFVLIIVAYGIAVTSEKEE